MAVVSVSLKVVITQSNYIPWKGYFDQMRMADKFVVFDDVQYTKRDWRNRNLVKTPSGLQWLTIPVQVKGRYQQKINETLVSDNEWPVTHLRTLRQLYKAAPFFNRYAAELEELYHAACKSQFLTDINLLFMRWVNAKLGINTTMLDSRDFALHEGRNEKLIGICKQIGATEYISGPAAKVYLDEALFRANGVQVRWMDYTGYPTYQQLYGTFEHGVTVLDLLFNTGPEAPKYLKQTIF